MIGWIVIAWLGVASAEVPEEEWAPLVGEEILLTNPAGKQIKGTLLSADGESIVVRRLKDAKEFTIPKGEVATAQLLDPPTEASVDVETPLETIVETTEEVAGTVVEGTSEAVESAKESTSEAVRDALGKEPPPPDHVPLDEQPDAPLLDEDAPILERPVLGDGKTYAEGLRAGKLDARGEDLVKPFAISAGVTCCATSVPCLVSPIFGGCVGLAAGAAGPVYYAGVRPYALKDELNAKVVDEPTEFAAGYVRGYTDEVQRRETLMAAAGAGAGFLVGAGVGLVGYLVVYNSL